jgi:hypothetical protein
VQLDAQILEARVLLGQFGGQLTDGGGRGTILVDGQQANGLAQQRIARVRAPLGTAEHGQQQGPGLSLLVPHLDRTAVETGPTEDPAVVKADQKAFQQDLAERVESGVRADVIRRFQLSQQVSDEIAPLANGQRALVPFAVLDTATMLAAGIGFGRQDAAVLAEPANAPERPARGGLHLLDPAAHLRGVRGCRRRVVRRQ